MSVGIFKNGKYNKVAGNAKDSTAANTTYNNGTSGLQANNVQSAIDELDSTVDTLNSNLEYFVDMKNNNNIFKFTDTYSLQINCQYGYSAMTIYGFMQNYGAFMVHVACISGNASIIDVINQASGNGFLKTRWDSNAKELHIYSESTERSFAGVVIGMLV